MAELNLRIALCGASGSGKSTLARHISKMYGVPYLENSAGLILDPEVQDNLVKKYGWDKSGHANVIRLGNINPQFAKEFQHAILVKRVAMMYDNEHYVFDRSPIDNMVYFLLQCGHLSGQELTEAHLKTCIAATGRLTHIFMVHTPPDNQEVENNGSRIPNWYYQRMVTSVFNHVLSEYIPSFKVTHLPMWDWETRKRIVNNILSAYLRG